MLLERPVKIVARKKIVLIIVEGPTDEDSLGLFYCCNQHLSAR